jgi:hypothetical protein
MPSAITLRSGLTINDPYGRVLRFCNEEFDYYDGVPDVEPDRIIPVDVLVTWSVNSSIYGVNENDRIKDPAMKVRAIHRGLAERCNSKLPSIPVDAHLLHFDPGLGIIGELLHEAIKVLEVGVPVAVKVLHRKRRNFIPMLDTIVRDHYLSKSEILSLNAQKNWNDKALVVSLALKALAAFRADLRDCLADVENSRRAIATSGYLLSAVGILEVLVRTKLRKVYKS